MSGKSNKQFFTKEELQDMIAVAPKPIESGFLKLKKRETPEVLANKPLRVAIQAAVDVAKQGIVATGKVESGILKSNDEVVFYPAKLKTIIGRIEEQHKNLAEALPGHNVGFLCKGLDTTHLSVLRKGQVCATSSKPIAVTTVFSAEIVSLDKQLPLSYIAKLLIHSTFRKVHIDIISELNPEATAIIKDRVKFIKADSIAVVKLRVDEPLALDKFTDNQTTGSFVIVENEKAVAFGIVTDTK